MLVTKFTGGTISMDILKEIAQGVLVIALIGALVVGVFAVAVNVTQSGAGTVPAENSHSGSDDEPELSFWVHHDLNAIPGFENVTPSDLPAAEKVENILNQSGVADKYTGTGWQNFSETLEVAVSFLENKGVEYHIDSENGLIVDTPGISYGTHKRGRAGMDYEYAFAEWYVAGPVPSLDFLRVLENHNIKGGVTGIFYGPNNGSYPRGRAIVPVKKGLVYVYVRSRDTWDFSRVKVNVEPGENYASLGKVDNICVHWRLGEGDYVQWNYVLENGEPMMVWPENAQPVGWEIRTS